MKERKYPNGVEPRIKMRGRQGSFSKKNERGTNKAPPDAGAWVGFVAIAHNLL